MTKISGLTQAEVAERIREGKINRGQEVRTKSFSDVLRTNLVTPFNALNLALAFIVVFLVHSPKNALFMIVVIFNALIGTVQELRAKRLMDKLALITAPKATVVRDGEKQEIPLDEIVLDDVLYLGAGMQIGADAVVVSGECEANESLMTGEQDPVKKQIGDDLISGSFIVSGPCYARAVRVGTDSYAARITAQSKYYKRPDSEIVTGVNKIIRFVSFTIIPLGLALFLKTLLITKMPYHEAAISTIAGLVGMIPEGLVLLTSVAMSVGAIKLSRYHALIQEMYAIETLARVDVLCLDKTGTITTGDIRLQSVKAVGETDEAGCISIAKTVMQELGDANATAKALLAAEEPALSGWNVIFRIPFSSSRKYSGVSVQNEGTYYLGSSSSLFRGNVKYAQLISENSEQARQDGLRVLMLAASSQEDAHEGIPADIRPLAFFYFTDEVRPNAKDTLSFFGQEGVELKVISGDDPVTVSRIAKEAGMTGWENSGDAAFLETEEECAEAIKKTTILGRVNPWQKFQFIKALKAEGHTVAMTGDGVNDVMALKESDCGVAMAAGSDAARNVSRIVLMDSDFASMPAIVAEGRQCINNLQRSSALFLSKTLFSAFAMLFFLFAPIAYPLIPIQLTLISTFTIGAPSVVLALLPNTERVEGNFLKNILRKAVPGAATNALAIVTVTVLFGHFGIDRQTVGTVAMLLMIFTNFLVLFKVCLPFNTIKIVLYAVMIACVWVAVRFFGGFFALVPLKAETIIVMLIIAGGLLFAYSGFLLLTEKVLARKK
ncbi:MAG: HAD-IC family P-type ATPase [Lachnospiraceae bacterium]|nr:HAD-IC family P-type ATPase [Lachnospiraceae bacterium]